MDTRIHDDAAMIHAFREGWRDAARDGACKSPREAIAALEALNRCSCGACADLYCNGADDGARGDAFRFIISHGAL